MSQATFDDEVFPFETLRDPFQGIENASETSQPENENMSPTVSRTIEQPNEEISKLLAEQYPECEVLFEAGKKRKRGHEGVPRASGNLFIDPVIDNEKWAQLESFFENEEQGLTLVSDELGSPGREAPSADAMSASTKQGVETQSEREHLDPDAKQSAQQKTTVRFEPFEADNEEAINTNISESLVEVNDSDALLQNVEANTEEKAERGMASEENLVRTDPRIAKCRKGRVMAPRVFNAMVETAEVQCEQCGHHFGSQLALKRHKQRAHKAEGSFQCHFCPQRLISETNRGKHERTQHDCSSGLRFECGYEGCTAFFNKKMNLSMHQRKFHGARFKSTKSDSRETSRDVYVCAFCEYSTKSRHNLNRHVFSRHGAGWETKGGHRFGCAQCGRRFVHLTNFRLHKCERRAHKRRRL